jgi:hypothetical protein
MLLLALLTACAPESGEACTDMAAASVSLTVTDPDGAAISDLVATFTVDGGDEQDCDINGTSVVCGYEQAGDIAVHLEASTYLEVDQTYTVEAGECHVEGKTDTIVMQHPFA